MPWVDAGATTNAKLTTSGSPETMWYGTIIEASSIFTPAPWIETVSAGSGYSGDAINPGIIWYWVR